MKHNELIGYISGGGLDSAFARLYGRDGVAAARERYSRAADAFASLYGEERELSVFSVPGRSELSGNHTDHNHGRVIACAVDLDAIAIASPRSDRVINVQSEGFAPECADGSDEPDAGEHFTGVAILRGMRAGMERFAGGSCGFDAYTTSKVLGGSGLSSSAAYEVLIGTIINHFALEGSVPAAKVARIAQFAENEYFGKPCGLMDQTACAVGGVVTIDFGDPERAEIERLDFDFTAAGYSLCIIGTGGSHAQLNGDYAAIPAEMKAVAAHFGRQYLRGLTTAELFAAAPELRAKIGDRAILRAYHFICENERVSRQAEALRGRKLDEFLALMLESGRSSFEFLQNVYTTQSPEEQGPSLALAVAENTLRGKKAAWRVHGGGFAGTIQALLPAGEAAALAAAEDAVFGDGAAMRLSVRSEGALRLL